MKLFVCILLELNFVVLIKKTSSSRNRVINQIHYSKFQVFGGFSCCESLVEIHPSIDFRKFHGTETSRNVVDRWLCTWRLLRDNSAKPMPIRFKNRNNPQRHRPKRKAQSGFSYIRLLTYPQFQQQVGFPLAHKFKQDPRSSPYQHKRLPQAKQSRKVQNSLRPWFSGLNKDS